MSGFLPHTTGFVSRSAFPVLNGTVFMPFKFHANSNRSRSEYLVPRYALTWVPPLTLALEALPDYLWFRLTSTFVMPLGLMNGRMNCPHG